MCRQLIFILLFIGSICIPGTLLSQPDSLYQKSLNTLTDVLHQQEKFIKVHAAEFLLWLNKENAEVQKIFEEQYRLYDNEPKYRIGVWRVLLQTPLSTAKKDFFLNNIMQIFADENAIERTHAIETLAKLKISPLNKYPEITNRAINNADNALGIYTLWAASYTSKAMAAKSTKILLQQLYNSRDTIIKKICAYVLVKSKFLTRVQWKALAQKALAEPQDSPFRLTILNTAFATYQRGFNIAKMKKLKIKILNNWQTFTLDQRINLCQALAVNGNKDDLPILKKILYNDFPSYAINTPQAADLSAFAAYAILKITDKKK